MPINFAELLATGDAEPGPPRRPQNPAEAGARTDVGWRSGRTRGQAERN